MKTVKANKTIEKIATVKNYLIKHYSNKNIIWKQIENDINIKLGLHPMCFYSIFYAGCLDKLGQGVYKLNNKINMANSEIYEKSKVTLYQKREARIGLVSPRNLEPKKYFTEQGAIDYLKNKGYKIMKPIQQFEEI